MYRKSQAIWAAVHRHRADVAVLDTLLTPHPAELEGFPLHLPATTDERSLREVPAQVQPKAPLRVWQEWGTEPTGREKRLWAQAALALNLRCPSLAMEPGEVESAPVGLHLLIWEKQP